LNKSNFRKIRETITVSVDASSYGKVKSGLPTSGSFVLDIYF